ncbi:sortase domain-containing protein [Microlunatus parietis]|uniref:LPXTG-site transpeptidase (Sortase) family protein n=1 Tax=Microlunatus parietis TaxID=682979 RepID=A0A7Y9IDF9_9ACTN|nr:sortase [Microlunatus parietis]NYE74754.1 LPXTG-site transpeptidase (sortase) family protein [Microlunatus parietis]
MSGLLVGCGTPPAAGPPPVPSSAAGGASSATPDGPATTGSPGSPAPESTSSGPATQAPERPYAKTSGEGSLPPRREASSPPDPDRSVPESELVRLEIPEVLTGDSGGAISPDPATNELVPPETSRVYRWAERGRPGSDAGDTVYLLGHTVRAGGGVFDPLQHVELGQSIMVGTENGTLTYRVQATKMYPKNEIQRADEVYESVPGRLVLVGCYLNADGSKQDLNFVVFAQLAG